VKKFRAGRAKHRVMTPLEFLARLAAIIPPPRYPLLRYHGVLGPRSSWRREIVPKPREESAAARPTPASPCPETPKQKAPRTDPPASRVSKESGARGERVVGNTAVIPSSVGAATASGKFPPPPREGAEILAPNVLSVRHWSRLLGGLLYASSPRIDWANLLRRSFDVDVLACATCRGRLRVLGEVNDPAIVRLVLESVGLPAEAPRVARARDPTELFATPDEE
jgi:Putative transposase